MEVCNDLLDGEPSIAFDQKAWLSEVVFTQLTILGDSAKSVPLPTRPV
jgi:hypothetical protein